MNGRGSAAAKETDQAKPESGEFRQKDRDAHLVC
jgi:hypothetical protein